MIKTLPPFTSSHIKAATYDTAKDKLEITFKDGAVYDYRSVGAQRWHAFQQAQSKGRYLNAKIEPNYHYKRV